LKIIPISGARAGEADENLVAKYVINNPMAFDHPSMWGPRRTAFGTNA